MNTIKNTVTIAVAIVIVLSVVTLIEETDADTYDKLSFEVGGQDFDSLVEAVGAIESTGTITVNITESGTGSPVSDQVTIPATKDITLDLNGCVVAVQNPIKVYGKLTIEDNSLRNGYEPVVSENHFDVTYESGELRNVYGSKATSAITLQIFDGGGIVQNSGTISSEWNYTVQINGNRAAQTDEVVESTMIMNGGYQIGTEGGPAVMGRGATFIMNDGVIKGTENSAIAGNGTVTNTEYLGGTIITINDGTLIGMMGDGNRNSGYSANAIYHPQNGTLTIYGGNIYVDRGTGIAIRAGTLNISDVNIIVTGTDEMTSTSSDGGRGKVGDSSFIIPPAAVIVDQMSNYPGWFNPIPTTVTISGGSFESNSEVQAIQYIENPDSEMKGTIDITGGTFTTDVSEFVDDGYIQVNGSVGRVSATVGSDTGSIDVSGSGNSVLIEVNENVDNVDVTAHLSSTNNGTGDVVMTYNGSLSIGGFGLSAIKIDSSDLSPNVDPENMISAYELTVSGGNVGYNLTVTFTVNVGDGMMLTSAWVVYYDDDGSTEIYQTNINGNQVTFQTGHTSSYVLYGTFEQEFVPNPPANWDDEDEYVPPSYVIQDSGSNDNTTTIVACAAAAVVAALIAAFLILDRRGS